MPSDRRRPPQRSKTGRQALHPAQMLLALPGFTATETPGTDPCRGSTDQAATPPPDTMEGPQEDSTRTVSGPAPVPPEEAPRAAVEPCEARRSASPLAEAVPVDRERSSDGSRARSARESPRAELSCQPALAESWGSPWTITKNSPQDARQLDEVGFGVPIGQLVALYELLRGHVQGTEPEPHGAGRSRRPEGNDSGRTD